MTPSSEIHSLFCGLLKSTSTGCFSLNYPFVALAYSSNRVFMCKLALWLRRRSTVSLSHTQKDVEDKITVLILPTRPWFELDVCRGHISTFCAFFFFFFVPYIKTLCSVRNAPTLGNVLSPITGGFCCCRSCVPTVSTVRNLSVPFLFS